MATSFERINEWLNLSTESPQLEFKEARAGFSVDKLFEYCVAISNERGGKLVLGISNEHPRRIVGTQAFLNLNKTAVQILEKLRFRVDIEEVDYAGKRLLIFNIPSRPDGCPCHVDGRYLMRSGESLVPMSPDHLRAIFDEGKPDWLEGAAETNLDRQQVIELLDTQTYFELLKTPYPTDRDGVIESLQQNKLVDFTSGGTCSIRRIGALLLAKRLDQFPELIRKAPRIIKYDGISKMATIADHSVEKGYAVGFRELVELAANLLPQNETMERALRVSVKLAPVDAVREVLANALIHQDFTATGTSVTLEIYDDRVDVTNPGEPIVDVERFIDGCSRGTSVLPV